MLVAKSQNILKVLKGLKCEISCTAAWYSISYITFLLANCEDFFFFFCGVFVSFCTSKEYIPKNIGESLHSNKIKLNT